MKFVSYNCRIKMVIFSRAIEGVREINTWRVFFSSGTSITVCRNSCKNSMVALSVYLIYSNSWICNKTAVCVYSYKCLCVYICMFWSCDVFMRCVFSVFATSTELLVVVKEIRLKEIDSTFGENECTCIAPTIVTEFQHAV